MTAASAPGRLDRAFHRWRVATLVVACPTLLCFIAAATLFAWLLVAPQRLAPEAILWCILLAGCALALLAITTGLLAANEITHIWGRLLALLAGFVVAAGVLAGTLVVFGLNVYVALGRA